MKIPLPQHSLLPPALQDKLRAAARIEPGIPAGGSFYRTREINRLVAYYQRIFPKLFRR